MKKTPRSPKPLPSTRARDRVGAAETEVGRGEKEESQSSPFPFTLRSQQQASTPALPRTGTHTAGIGVPISSPRLSLQRGNHTQRGRSSTRSLLLHAGYQHPFLAFGCTQKLEMAQADASTSASSCNTPPSFSSSSSRSITTTRSRIETSIPRKHGPAIAGYESALKKFFENVLQAVLKHIDFKVVRCLVIASPGFTKDQFHDYLILEAERRSLRPIIENKSCLVLAHSTSGYKHSLKEVLDAPNVMALIKDTKAALEVRALKDFFDMLSNDTARACYGPKHVEVSHERMAIQTLLITDSLFKNADVLTRQKYVNLVDSVKNSGGRVHIFSSMHVSGEQLAQLTGIAAILRFPLPELEDIEM